eukprot:TRINITY_DN15823_c0_g1_i1.p1 TRINITY_DN15823_c0_g1~~TRINITY_DN15823_c0_g1_i1.p1  ORF type:complete len:251 (+),score=78.67 TRINITY_DN15823_c0_g1_i1:94-846(+)
MADSAPTLDDLDEISRNFLESRKDLGAVDIYNKWKLICTKEEIQLAVKNVARQIEGKFEGENILLVCILKGCAYFFVDLTRALKIPYSIYFIEASSYHNSQTQSETVELLSVLVKEKFENKKVILVDELYDNGTTLQCVKEKVMEELLIPESEIFTCTLFRKDKQVTQPLPDYVGIDTIPDLWVVGYGLDDQQEKRGWDCLYACPKLPEIPKIEEDKIFDESEEGLNVYKNIRQKIINVVYSQENDNNNN